MEVTPNSKLKSASPCEPKDQLSASLKERLKRTRRSFNAPSSIAKRLCVDEEDGQHVSQETGQKSSLIPSIVDANSNVAQSSNDQLVGGDSKHFTQQREQLRREVREKTETLRRLKMVKMYRSKNDLTQLQTLIDKWRRCAQAALLELQSYIPVSGQKPGLADLIDLFGLDDNILHFDRALEDFTS
ncbi:swi5-dependent recombination DNA repair protein 1 homolog [Synchiropus splendidus]|uniref:swi5-dependent recombination DNA repair protein 1 homolog n=1 Tax=Synchiropus splendidus TaxID=270530 RepID=UPI00237EDC7D|nr:swi5-dependent recombination DNA repair protein 1 homolog [Synchiropus splendidus]